jgi:hypothetical protein
MSEATDVRAELRLAEERLAELRARNAQLESTLLKPTALRNRMIATLTLAALGGALGHVGATRTGDARAARARAQRAEAYEDLRAARQRGIDACQALLQREKNDVLACTAQRDELQSKLPPQAAHPAVMDPKCRCQAGDPLCSCL